MTYITELQGLDIVIYIKGTTARRTELGRVQSLEGLKAFWFQRGRDVSGVEIPKCDEMTPAQIKQFIKDNEAI